jgi:mono/diheme cytochrome c family protein
MILMGVGLVILLLLSGNALMVVTDREVKRGFTLQAPSVYAATPNGQGQDIFDEKCQGCHTIGGGKTVGPDLKGVTDKRDRDWLIRFITSPEQLIEQGDLTAKQLVEEYGMPMPDLGLSDDDAEEVLAYVEMQSGGEASSPSPEQNTDGTPVLSSGDAGKGKDIFTGSISLKNGGIACISCHNIGGVGAFGGGAMGGDLTEIYSALGESSLTPLLETTPFPIMTEIYTEQPLTDDEVANLVAFMKEAGSSQEVTSDQNFGLFVIISIAGFLLIMVIFQLLWRGRLSGVRKGMVKGGS